MSQPLTQKVFRLDNGYENDLKQAYGEIFANLASMNIDGRNCEQGSGVRRANKRLAKRRGFANRSKPELSTEEALMKVSDQDCLRNGHEGHLKNNHIDPGIHSYIDNVSCTHNGIEDGQKQSHQKLRRLNENRSPAIPKAEISSRDLRHNQSDSKDLLEDTEFRNNLDVSSSSGSESYFENQVETAFNIIHDNIDQIRPRQNLRLGKTEDIYDHRLKQKIIRSLKTCDTSVEMRPLHYKTIRTKHDILYVIKADV